MKTVFLIVTTLLMGTASATGGAKPPAGVKPYSRVSIVVKHPATGEFFVERVPIIACEGLVQGPQLAQWVENYLVPANVGGGSGSIAVENINYLSCSQYLSAKFDLEGRVTEVILDISKCPDKNDSKFITMARTAAKYNFPQATSANEVALYLVKDYVGPAPSYDVSTCRTGELVAPEVSIHGLTIIPAEDLIESGR